MPTTMQMAKLDLVAAGTPGAMRVAVLDAPGKMSMAHALAPEPGDDWKMRDSVQALTLNALRGLGVVDARARGLVVQAVWPKEVAA